MGGQEEEECLGQCPSRIRSRKTVPVDSGVRVNSSGMYNALG